MRPAGRVLTRYGFTLVEILIVVIILGILAAIVIPNVSNASNESKDAMLKENLRVMRTQIGVYRAQHGDVSPGYPDGDKDSTPTEETFIAQMTLSSNINGETAAINTPGYPYGPYFREIPANPLNGLKTVEIVSDIELHADNADADGKCYYEY